MTTLPDFLLARLGEDEALLPEWVAALRQVVAEHHPTEPFNNEGDRYCANCLHGENRDDYPDFWTQQMYPCRTLRIIALPYANHPDYRPEWRP